MPGPLLVDTRRMSSVLEPVLGALGGAVAGVPLAAVAERFRTTPGTRRNALRIAAVLATALGCALMAWRFAGAAELAAYLAFAGLAVPLAIVDAAEKRLPNRLVLVAGVTVGVLLVVAALVEGRPLNLLAGLLGGVGMFAVYLVLAVAARGGVGMGDVKLAAVLGLALGYLGWSAWAIGLVAGLVINGVVAIVGLATRRTTLRGSVPFGPSMLVGALLAIAFA